MIEAQADIRGLKASVSGVSAAEAWRPEEARQVAAATVYNDNTQNFYFEQPMQAPDEIAREARLRLTYGLAGAR